MRKLGKRLSLVLFGTLLGLVAGEVAVRALGFEEELARRQTAFDPRYGTVRADSWVWDFEIDPARDEIDLRGQRVRRRKPAGETRVLFVGDSGTEGVRLPLDATFPALFERELGGGVRAVNAGVFGMTTIDELHFLELRLLPLDPDVVVIGLFMSNDLNFNIGHAERLRSVAPRSMWFRGLVHRSALAHLIFLRAVTLNARYRWLSPGDLSEESVVPRDVTLIDERGLHMLSYPMGEVATYAQPPSALIDHAHDVLANVLWRFRELGRRNGFEVRVLIIPTPSTVAGRLTFLHYPTILEDLRAQGIAIDEASLDFDAPTRRVLATCDELAIRCIDPTERMREIGLGVFFADDEHPNATGHAVVASALAAAWQVRDGE